MSKKKTQSIYERPGRLRAVTPQANAKILEADVKDKAARDAIEARKEAVRAEERTQRLVVQKAKREEIKDQRARAAAADSILGQALDSYEKIAGSIVTRDKDHESQVALLTEKAKAHNEHRQQLEAKLEACMKELRVTKARLRTITSEEVRKASLEQRAEALRSVERAWEENEAAWEATGRAFRKPNRDRKLKNRAKALGLKTKSA